MEVFNLLIFRIGTSTRDDLIKKVKRENIPGPGNYMLKLNNSTPSFRFGTEKRDKSAAHGVPGPGQYRIPCSIVDVPQYSMTGNFNQSYRYI